MTNMDPRWERIFGFDAAFIELVLRGTIIFWSHALDYLSYRFPKLRLLIEPAPLELIRNGRIQRRNLRQELISIDDLTPAFARRTGKSLTQSSSSVAKTWTVKAAW